MNEPTAGDPLLLRCVVCDGEDSETCSACHGLGTFEVVGCPWKQETADVTAALEMERLLREGAGLPVSGGWLDQTRVGLDALTMIQRERASWKRAAESDS